MFDIVLLTFFVFIIPVFEPNTLDDLIGLSLKQKDAQLKQVSCASFGRTKPKNHLTKSIGSCDLPQYAAKHDSTA